MSLALTVLRFALPWLLGALALGVGYYKAQHWCNTVCLEKGAKLKQAEQQIEDARQRATDLALLWAKEVDQAEEKNRAAANQRAKDFAALEDRVRSLSSRLSIALSADADRVWRDSSREANAARDAQEHPETADPVPNPTYSEQDLAAFFVAAAKAYADAYGQWLACVNYYEGLRELSHRGLGEPGQQGSPAPEH
jgi:hypothetical protein